MSSQNKRAMIVGSAGQDGVLLTEHLQPLNYQVVPVTKKDDLSKLSFTGIDEIYYLAAYHHTSQDQIPDEAELLRKSTEVHVTGLGHCLEGILKAGHKARLFYASSSMVFGKPASTSQSESTPLAPDTAYGITKQQGMLLCKKYRETKGVYASSGILYNHESRYRKPQFLSRKVVLAATRIKNGSQEKLKLGDLDSTVDWSDARDFVRAFQLILQCKEPQDFVISSGIGHTVRDFVQTTFGLLNLDWKDHVELDKDLIQRAKHTLVGNSSKLKMQTKWVPQYDFKTMIRDMIMAEGVSID
ncbi:MAG: GDP-mannose 4,6-dehydratase [Xanthomonadaceae bacterium]|nr:GDP-mannose 4,6-dehydratase [Xanthomonadaceae bacterium]